MTNINYAEINKSKVLASNFIVPLAAPLFILMLPILDQSLSTTDAGDIIPGILFSLILGAVVWLPTVLFLLMIEMVIINEKTKDKHIMFYFMIEGVLAYFIILFVFEGFGRGGDFPIALFVAITIPQLLRWWYLKHKGRMYTSAPSKNEIDQI